MYYVGVDVGGMSIKAGIVDSDGKIILKKAAVTQPDKPSSELVADIARLINSIIEENGMSVCDISGAGLGIPGSVYDEKGLIRYTCNINFKNTPIVQMLKELTGIRNIKISNDANCAALAETKYGAGNGALNSVMITLGTGVGTGIIVDGELLRGNQSAGAEGGHVTINFSGPECGCGKRGHYEAYASVTALIGQTADAMKKHPESAINQIVEKHGLNGKTLFIAAKCGDKTAKRTLNRYLRYVGTGLVNYANIFYPEVIIIGGGICNEGDVIIKPLQKYVSENVYGASYTPPIKVAAATLKNDAGIIGAAMLAM